MENESSFTVHYPTTTDEFLQQLTLAAAGTTMKNVGIVLALAGAGTAISHKELTDPASELLYTGIGMFAVGKVIDAYQGMYAFLKGYKYIKLDDNEG